MRIGITKLEGALIIALLIALSFAGYAWFAKKPAAPPTPPPPPQTITIVDSAGRYVEVPFPVKRIAALSGYAALILVALGAKDTIVGLPESHIDDPWAPSVTNIGSCFKPNIEAIIATKPEVVITYVEYPKPEELEEKLEPLGLKVVRLDFYKIDTLFAETRLLGLMVDKTREADELITYWKGVLDLIDSKVKGLKPEERLRVYWESFSDYTAAGPGSADDVIIRLAGGINIFAEAPVPYPKVTPEAVIKENPDIIFKSFYSAKFKAWNATDPGILKETRNAIMTRPGWSEIKAVKNGKVYVIAWGFLTLGGYGRVAITTYVAKILHPDLFKDVNPEDYFKAWSKQLGVEYRGIWIWPPLE